MTERITATFSDLVITKDRFVQAVGLVQDLKQSREQSSKRDKQGRHNYSHS